MPILTLQRRLRELGRIRMGVQKPTGRVRNGRATYRPEKLDRFRITSASKPLLERVAELYGGNVQPWDNNGSAQFEVITTSTRLPVLVPPQAVSQYFELWSEGGCQRRCDGETELLRDEPCPCGPDPFERQCKPTTRLNVILREVEGIGVFRLESHGYYSATELPDVAAFLARAGAYVEAWLGMEERTAIRGGKTRRWMVPTLEVNITPSALLAGNGSVIELPGPQASLGAGTATQPAESTPSPAGEEERLAEWVSLIKAAPSLDALRELWRERPTDELPPHIKEIFTARAATLRIAEEEGVPSSPADTLWLEALSVAPEDWSAMDVERHFTEITGVDPSAATVEDIRRYLDTAYPVAAAHGEAS